MGGKVKLAETGRTKGVEKDECRRRESLKENKRGRLREWTRQAVSAIGGGVDGWALNEVGSSRWKMIGREFHHARIGYFITSFIHLDRLITSLLL